MNVTLNCCLGEQKKSWKDCRTLLLEEGHVTRVYAVNEVRVRSR